MRFRAFLPVFLFILSGLLYSQKTSDIYKLTGMVADEATGKELVKATVAVNSRKENKTIAGTTTDEKGYFTVENINESAVRIKFSMMGYQPVVIDSVDLSQTSRIGLIKLKSAAIVLPDVVIKTVKPMIEYHSDRQVLNMDRLPGNSGSVTEALKNSGTVDVDPQNNKITVRGQDVKLQMDGHEYTMPSEMLSQLPASMIDQVEVILAPGAKESAEGGTYILNLVSKKNKIDNYSGSINLNTSTNKQNSGGLNLNYKLGKLNLFSQMYAAYYESLSSSAGERYNYISRTMYHQGSSSDNNNYFKSGYFKLGFDYDFDESNSVTAYASYTGSDNNTNTSGSNYVNDNNDILQYKYFHNKVFEGSNKGLSFYGFYKTKFETKGNELTFDILYNDIKSPQNSKMNLDYSSRPGRPDLQNSDQGTDAATMIFKTDYVYPFKVSRFEAGYNLTVRSRESDYNVMNYSYLTNGWKDSLNLSNLFHYNENIHALYATYSHKIDKFDIKAGLRMENLSTEGDQVTTGEKFSSNFLSLFPNLNLSYKFSDLFQLGFTAFRRVRYPMVFYVNPFKRYYGPNSYSAGNPKLEPTYINSYAVNLSQYINTYYVYSTGMFTGASALENDSIMVNSYINLNKNHTYGVDLTLPYYNTPLSPFHLPDFISMLNLQYSFLYRHQTGGYINEDLSYIERSYSLRANVGLKLWYDVSMNIYFSYRPRVKNGKVESNEMKDLYISFSKTLFEQKLRLNLSISDVLNSQKYENQSFGSNFYSRGVYTTKRSQAITLGITWMFNDYKERRDRNVDDGRDASGGGQGRGGM